MGIFVWYVGWLFMWIVRLVVIFIGRDRERESGGESEAEVSG